MSGAFANSLRARPGVIAIAETGTGTAVRFRAEVQSLWDVVRLDGHTSDSVHTAKVYALNALVPTALFPDDFSVKLNGCEIFDEAQSLGDVGVVDGSTLLIAHRRRRPVRS